MAESEEGLKSLLMRVKQESEKAGLKLNIQKTKIMGSGPITSWQIDGGKWKQWQRLFSWAPKSLQMVTAAMKLEMLSPWKDNYNKPGHCVKEQRHHFAKKGLYSQSYGLSSSHVWMWELDQKEGWSLKNQLFRILRLEKTLESLLDCKEVKRVNPKGNQPWIFTGRTDTKADVPILWPRDAKSQLIGKTLMLGKTEGRRRRGWQRMKYLDGIIDTMYMSLSKLRDSEEHENLACRSSSGCKESEVI